MYWHVSNVSTWSYDDSPRAGPFPGWLIAYTTFRHAQITDVVGQQYIPIIPTFYAIYIYIYPAWWYTYPSETYEFVSWEYEIPNIWKVIKFHGSKPPTSISHLLIVEACHVCGHFFEDGGFTTLFLQRGHHWSGKWWIIRDPILI